MGAARQRRTEKKRKRLKDRYASSLAWQEHRKHDFLYLGADVPSELGKRYIDEARLQRSNLPVLSAASDLSEAIGISLAELRFLSFARLVSEISHYRQFSIAKKTGGERLITAPMARPKRARYWILEKLLTRFRCMMQHMLR